jgi:hypothetical protein
VKLYRNKSKSVHHRDTEAQRNRSKFLRFLWLCVSVVKSLV